MIRFSAGLVVVAIGVLIGGVATSKLSLVYVAIAVSAVALVALAIGVALKRDELFGGGSELAPAGVGAGSGMPVGQPADAGHVRGNDGHVREDLEQIRPAVPVASSALFGGQDAPAAAASTTAPAATAWPSADRTAVDNSPFGNPGLGQRRSAFSQTSTREADSAADWQTRSPQPPWSSGDQARPSWTAKEPQSAPAPPAPAAASPRGWGSSDQPPTPSWFDRLNQPVADASAPTTTNPAKPEPPKPEPAKPEPSKPEPPKAEPAETEPSKTSPAVDTVDTDDDDWPTRYSWLEDDESDEAAEPDAAEPDVAEVTDVTDAAETEPAKTLSKEAKAAEPDAASPDATATTPDADAEDHAAQAEDVAAAADSQPAEPADTPAVDEDEPSAPRQSDVKLVTVIPGVPRYHDPDCILIRFMDDDDIARKSIPEAKAANCTPCAACEPEG